MSDIVEITVDFGHEERDEFHKTVGGSFTNNIIYNDNKSVTELAKRSSMYVVGRRGVCETISVIVGV